jgi:hypothetical protein
LLDPRLTPARTDLAAKHQPVAALRFVIGEARMPSAGAVAPRLPTPARPRRWGERVTVYDY